MSTDITRISLNSNGQQINDAFLYVDTEISPDGRYVAFLTDAPTLTPGIPPKGFTSNPGYWFVKDTQTGHVARVAAENLLQNSDFIPALLKNNYDVTLSNGFGVVTYGAYAARFNLDTGALIGNIDIPDQQDFFTTAYTSGSPQFIFSDNYHYDVGTGSTRGRFGEIEALETTTSASSKMTFSLNTYADKKDGTTDLSVVEEVSFSDASADGRYVSVSINARGIKLSPGSADYGLIGVDYGVFDRVAQKFTRLTDTIPDAARNFSASTSFIEDPFYDAYVSDISDDGSTIVFSSAANTIVAGDTNDRPDVFAANTQTKVVSRISTTNDKKQLNGDSIVPSISGNGHYALFVSSAPELGPANTLYVRDMRTGEIKRVDMTIDGKFAGVASKQAEISYDGKYIVFSSAYSNYVLNDTNNVTDVFEAANPFLVAAQRSPVEIKLASSLVAELAKTGTAVGTLSAVDTDAGDTFTFKLLDSAGGRFSLSGSTLKVANGLLLDYEQAKSDTVKVQVTDSQGHSLTKTLTLTIKDVNPEKVTGSARAETFVGGVKGDTLSGGSGNDTLTGGGGNDTLDGGLGKDTLKGDAGRDTFFFSTKPSSSNLDHVKDFRTIDDTIKLENSGAGLFNKLAKGGLDDDALAFVTSGKAVVGDDVRILYDKGHGALYYDPNGGSAAGRVEFAVLDNHAALTFKDFLIV